MAARVTKVPPVQRTLSLFTGKTDDEDPNARDGSPPDPVSDYNQIQLRPRYKWERFQLTRYECSALNALIEVEREGGAWSYRVIRSGYQVGIFKTICEAADAAEASPVRGDGK